VLNGLTWSVWSSRGAGLVLALDGGLILLPMLRNTITFIRRYVQWLLPADENIWFHKQVAYSMAFWAAVHTTAHYVNFFNVERLRAYPHVNLHGLGADPLVSSSEVRKQTAVEIHYTQPGGVTGHFLLLIMVLMYTTAQKEVRQQSFETFWYTHHLAFFFMLGLYAHATGCFVRDSINPDYTRFFPFYSTEHCLGYESWRFIIWPGIAYFMERVYREIRARRVTRLDKVFVHPSGMVCLLVLVILLY
jgi:NADPH oxidase 1